MPLWPRFARTKSMTWSRPGVFARTHKRRFGRSKPCTKTVGWRRQSLPTMSARVAVSAVAVNATVWTPPSSLGSAERQVVRAEGVPPLRDAMGLVDRERPDPGAPDERERVGWGKPLGRDIDQT